MRGGLPTKYLSILDNPGRATQNPAANKSERDLQSPRPP